MENAEIKVIISAGKKEYYLSTALCHPLPSAEEIKAHGEYVLAALLLRLIQDGVITK